MRDSPAQCHALCSLTLVEKQALNSEENSYDRSCCCFNRQSTSTKKVVADEVASHVNPKGPPLNATATMTAVPRLRRNEAGLIGCCNCMVLCSAGQVMVLVNAKAQKSLWAGIGT